MNNLDMKISVIVPTYKPKDYLWKCLDSLVSQTLSSNEWELLIVLNGCCDPWHKHIEQYICNKMQGMNVEFIHTDTPGVSNARNKALDLAKGEYVTFIDDDDYVSPKYLEELLKAATPNTISLSYPYAFDDGCLNIQRKYTITDAYEYCEQHGCGSLSSKVRKFFSGPCMKLIPMSFIQERRFDVRFANGEDSLFMFLISDKIKHTAIASREAVYFRRVRNDGANYTPQPLSNIVKNRTLLIIEYTKIYFANPLNYSLKFYLSRILASLNTIIKKIIKLCISEQTQN